jgi:hypothetical protein
MAVAEDCLGQVLQLAFELSAPGLGFVSPHSHLVSPHSHLVSPDLDLRPKGATLRAIGTDLVSVGLILGPVRIDGHTLGPNLASKGTGPGCHGPQLGHKDVLIFVAGHPPSVSRASSSEHNVLYRYVSPQVNDE